MSFLGGQGQNRTADTKIFSLLLYLLSYLPTDSGGLPSTVLMPQPQPSIATDPYARLQDGEAAGNLIIAGWSSPLVAKGRPIGLKLR